jgi:hypothetical protein
MAGLRERTANGDRKCLLVTTLCSARRCARELNAIIKSGQRRDVRYRTGGSRRGCSITAAHRPHARAGAQAGPIFAASVAIHVGYFATLVRAYQYRRSGHAYPLMRARPAGGAVRWCCSTSVPAQPCG